LQPCLLQVVCVHVLVAVQLGYAEQVVALVWVQPTPQEVLTELAWQRSEFAQVGGGTHAGQAFV